MECPICFERKDDVSCCVPCGHVFCTVCLERHMLTANEGCPNCRAQTIMAQRVYLDRSTKLGTSKEALMKRLLDHVENGRRKMDVELFCGLCFIVFYHSLLFEAIRLLLTMLLIFWIHSLLVLAVTCFRNGDELDMVLLFKAGSIDLARKLCTFLKFLHKIFSLLYSFPEQPIDN
ncbi:hypothetical protein CHS0354_040024 [Potamilus streckersoni]|uniref:RING-type domain-containing protein n=1 Tax=Potamilus streckersoni TaxID=2493646 RepID=A0AAE0ST65_9BIVA|nr:hypothetical protein CHS0354_040024 [Potamilus streckersoni]